MPLTLGAVIDGGSSPGRVSVNSGALKMIAVALVPSSSGVALNVVICVASSLAPVSLQRMALKLIAAAVPSTVGVALTLVTVSASAPLVPSSHGVQ